MLSDIKRLMLVCLYRANESHTEHLQHIELEMETQMTKLEARVREEEKETAIIEKEELKKRLEAEITELQANLSRFHSVSSNIL